jgi:hypothetical protein
MARGCDRDRDDRRTGVRTDIVDASDPNAAASVTRATLSRDRAG